MSAVQTRSLQEENVVIFLLCVALAVCLVVIVILIFTIKKNREKPPASVALKTDAMSSGYQEVQPADDALVYSTVLLRKNSRAGARDPQTTEEECVYSDVTCLGLD